MTIDRIEGVTIGTKPMRSKRRLLVPRPTPILNGIHDDDLNDQLTIIEHVHMIFLDPQFF